MLSSSAWRERRRRRQRSGLWDRRAREIGRKAQLIWDMWTGESELHYVPVYWWHQRVDLYFPWLFVSSPLTPPLPPPPLFLPFLLSSPTFSLLSYSPPTPFPSFLPSHPPSHTPKVDEAQALLHSLTEMSMHKTEPPLPQWEGGGRGGMD